MKPLNILPIVMLLLLGCAQLKAQFGLAAGLDYNVDVKRPGFFLRGIYTIDSTWRAAGTFNYFIDNRNGFTNLELAADGHYRFFANRRWRTYLIGGLNLFHTTIESAEGNRSPKNKFGINMGLGAQLNLSGPVQPFAEMKVSVGDGSLFGMFIGIQYFFPKKTEMTEPGG